MYLLFLVQKIDLVWDLKSYFSDKYDIWYYNNDLFYLKKSHILFRPKNTIFGRSQRGFCRVTSSYKVGLFPQYCISHFENVWRFKRLHKIHWVEVCSSGCCRQKPQYLVSYKEAIPGWSKPEFCYITINNDINISISLGHPGTW